VSKSVSKVGRFLIATALEEFWETSRPVVFLGEWCRRYSRKDSWAGLGDCVVPDLWADPAVTYRAYEYTRQLYERMLGPVGQALNQLHRVSHSGRYWRIVIGPWLQSYIGILYERYSTIAAALSLYPDLTSAGLEESSWVVPQHSLDFIALVQEDFYNLQLYTRMLQHFGASLMLKPCQARISKAVAPPEAGLANAARRLLKPAFNGPTRFVQRFASVLHDGTYFSAGMQVRLMLATFGSVVRMAPEQLPDTALGPTVARSDLHVEYMANEAFESFALSTIPLDMPRSFVEDFATVGEAARYSYPSRPRAIFSANCWYSKEPFKRWAADAAENGAILLGTQHGGNYGSIEPLPNEDHEMAIVDRYYTWGWLRDGSHGDVVPMPATKLAGRKSIGANNRKQNILYVTTCSPRYQSSFPFTVDHFREYLEWQQRFLGEISESMRSATVVRLHFEDFGWDIGPRLRDRFPGLRFGTWETPFAEALSHCRLYVCDHLSTTFVEALAMDVPTVLFWSPRWNRVRAEAEPYYVALRSVGILHNTPEAAAAAIESIGNVEEWWDDSQRQSARKSFVNQFGLTVKSPTRVWAKELRRYRSRPSKLSVGETL